jgi:flagellar motor protein MotB
MDQMLPPAASARAEAPDILEDNDAAGATETDKNGSKKEEEAQEEEAQEEEAQEEEAQEEEAQEEEAQEEEAQEEEAQEEEAHEEKDETQEEEEEAHRPQLWEPTEEDIARSGWFSSYFFDAPDKRFGVHKWAHYMPVYEKHLARFQGKDPVILEVGVAKGGSVEMWNRYFGGRCTIYGVDLMRKCQVVEDHFPNAHIVRGDQADPNFWRDFRAMCPKVDILLEDGGHKMHQQIRTFECMYDHVKDDGLYLCEDMCTSYRPEYGGGLGKGGTFVEYTKGLIDQMNAHHIRASSTGDHTNYPLDFRHVTASITFYDGVVAFEKRVDHEVPYGALKGGKGQCVWCNRILAPGEAPHEKLECQTWLRQRYH